MKNLIIFFLLIIIVAGWIHIRKQDQLVDELIELNHDKSVFIDNGCPGQFKGSEEYLSTEPR